MDSSKTEPGSALPQHVDEAPTRALLKALQALSDQYDLGMDRAALGAAEHPHPQDASFYLQTLFPARSVSHTEERGEAPSGAYPGLLAAYAAASGDAFDPQDIEADSDDGWNSLSLEFRHAGKAQQFKVSGIEDSDWFTSHFVQALNRYAKRQGLAGRWVDFHNGEDACTSIYVPEAAQARFKALKKKYSASTEEDFGRTAELLADAESNAKPGLLDIAVQFDAEQLAARKSAWPEIESRLRLFYNKSEIKAFQHYYLTGKESTWDDQGEGDPIPLVYRLWLHPEQSDAAWCAITERVLSYESELVIGRSLSASYLRLSEPFSAMPDLFGADRQRLTQFLQGSTPPGDRYRFLGEPLYYHNDFAFVDYTDLCQWLYDPASAQPPGPLYDPERTEDWVEYLCGPHFEQIMARGDSYETKAFLQIYLEYLASYPAPVEGDGDLARQQHCHRCCDALNASALPAPLDEWWARAKSKASA